MLKKYVHNELVIEVHAIQTNYTSNLVNKTDYDTKPSEIEKKITDHDHIISMLLKKNLIN